MLIHIKFRVHLTSKNIIFTQTYRNGREKEKKQYNLCLFEWTYMMVGCAPPCMKFPFCSFFSHSLSNAEHIRWFFFLELQFCRIENLVLCIQIGHVWRRVFTQTCMAPKLDGKIIVPNSISLNSNHARFCCCSLVRAIRFFHCLKTTTNHIKWIYSALWFSVFLNWIWTMFVRWLFRPARVNVMIGGRYPLLQFNIWYFCAHKKVSIAHTQMKLIINISCLARRIFCFCFLFISRWHRKIADKFNGALTKYKHSKSKNPSEKEKNTI